MYSISPDSNQVQLKIYDEGRVYSIGEPIQLKLQILNNSNQQVAFGYGFRFDWEDLAFAETNFVHLIGPDGRELALPYRRDKSYFSTIKPIFIEAGKESWLYLPIYIHFNLDKPGEYLFWLELLDNSGELHRSNKINFKLVDVDASVPPEFIEMIIRSAKTSYTIREPVDIDVKFTNNHDQPIIFMKLQEDSFYGWVNPVYKFVVADKAGCIFPLALRSGSMAIPVYDEKHQFTIAPGESYVEQLRLPDFPKMQSPGNYLVRLIYIMREKAIGKAGIVLDKQMNWNERVFIGRIESNEIKIIIN